MLATLILTAALSKAAPAIAPPTASPNALAFGLDKLQWGMNAREASRHYPALEGTAPEAGEAWNILSLNNFGYAGCAFTVTLSFDRGLLNEVELESVGTARLERCEARIRAALVRQYGGEPGGFSTESHPHGYSEYGAWRGPVTEVTYSALQDGFIQIRFARTPSR